MYNKSNGIWSNKVHVYMCMANINYGDQTLGEREVTCRANKHIPKNIYLIIMRKYI